MPVWIDARGCELFVLLYMYMCTYVHCDAVLVALLLPFFAFTLLCTPTGA